MTISARDRRALLYLGVACLLSAIVYFWPSEEAAPVVSAAEQSIPLAEARLDRLRRVAATVPAREQAAAAAVGQLKQQEKGMIDAETGPQAQARLLQILRKLARSQTPPVDITQNEIGIIQTLGQDYGEGLVSVTMNCRIEQLVNLLADLTAQPELIATHELRISQYGEPKQKLISVRLTVSGVLPKRLAPERKGLGL